MSGITVKFKARLGQRGRKAAERPAQCERVPRVARLMALAIWFDQLIKDGVVANQAELARLGHVTRARLTQIMNLLHLAPDIQEEILFLRRAERGVEQLTMRDLVPIAWKMDWRTQRRMWHREERLTVHRQRSAKSDTQAAAPNGRPDQKR